VDWKTPPALGGRALLAVLTVVLAACGGGSTAGPIAQSPVATTTSAAPPAQTAPTAPSTVAATQPAPARTGAAVPAPRPATRPHGSEPGGATPPRSGGEGAVVDAPPPAAETPTPPAPAEPAATPLDERATLVLTRRVTPAHYFQQGTVTGTYAGTMEVEARITSKGVLVRFTATLPGGTISGRGIAIAILDSATWPGLRGRAIVTGGTGRFAGIHGRGLRVTGRAKPDASRARVRLAGTVSGI
jgi:hypothetical protein